MFFMFKTPINKRRSNTIYPLQKHHKLRRYKQRNKENHI